MSAPAQPIGSITLTKELGEDVVRLARSEFALARREFEADRKAARTPFYLVVGAATGAFAGLELVLGALIIAWADRPLLTFVAGLTLLVVAGAAILVARRALPRPLERTRHRLAADAALIGDKLAEKLQ